MTDEEIWQAGYNDGFNGNDPRSDNPIYLGGYYRGQAVRREES